MISNLKTFVLVSVVLAVCGPHAVPVLAAAASSKMVVPLLRVGSDDDVRGTADFRSRRGKSRFKVRVKHAEANDTLSIVVGGVVRASVTTNRGGNAVADFRSGAVAGKQLALDFDPRGEAIEIENETETLLDDRTDDGSNPPGTQVDERINLSSTGVQPGASGHARLRESKGKRGFSVEIEDVNDGIYDFLVGGVVRGTIVVGGGEGEIEFASGSDDPGKLPLDFDPLGGLLQVAQGATIVLTGEMLAPAPGVNVCTPSETTTLLGAVGPDPDAHGEARVRIEDDCDRDFRIEIEDLPVGDYELVVDGVVRGTVSVALVLGEERGEVEFDSDPDEPGELPLDFDPTGAAIEIRQGAIVFLSGSAGTPGPGTCDLVDVEPMLENSGADRNAKGKARFRQETDCARHLRVQVEDVPLGDYQLLVGGVPRGTVTVTAVLGEHVGEIEFASSPDQPGELLLDFDPRGQLLEVKQGMTLFLSVTLPS